MYTVISRERWELDSLQRYLYVCLVLLQDPDNIVYKGYRDFCSNIYTMPRQIDVSRFVNVATSCMFGIYCPSFTESVTNEFLLDGLFLHRPTSVLPCPKGFFCKDGMIIPCPPGFTCPVIGLSSPMACTRDKTNSNTCYQAGLTQAAKCPDGFICATTYFTPLGVPPGYYLSTERYVNGSANINGLRRCKTGDYCPFGATVVEESNNSTSNATHILCPAFTYCTDPTVLFPTACNASIDHMLYCPAGTSYPELCPAGYYCTRPDKKIACVPTEYCPLGTVVNAVCPAGYFCPNSSTQYICPTGFFCKQGSIRAEKCSFFVAFFMCNTEGVKSNPLLPFGIAIIVFTILLFGIVYVAVFVCFKCTRANKKTKDVLPDMFEGLSTKSKVDIRFKNLGLQLFNGKRVLRGVTGEIKHGQLTAYAFYCY